MTLQVSDAAAGASPAKTARPYGYVVAAILGVVYTLNFLDRQFLSVLQEPVKHELHLTDTQLGLLTGTTFALFYTVCGVPVAMLADRFHRVRIVAAACAAWSLFTALCGFATGFVFLAAARIGVGIGEAGGSPPSYSILSDYFPPRQRATALAIYSLGVPLGAMFGTMAGGFIAAAYGWRTAFWALGAVGLVVAPLVPLLVREPARGGFDIAADPAVAAHEPAPGMFAAAALFARSPVLTLTAISAGLTALVGYGVLVWSPSLLLRTKGMTLPELAVWYALVTGVMNVAGTFLSGVVTDRVGRRWPQVYAWAPGAAILLSTPFVWGAALAPDWRTSLAFLAGPALLNNMYLAPCLAVVQNAVPARSRGVAGALLLFVLNLLGLGVGPVFVGKVSDLLRPSFGLMSLPYALIALTPFFLAAGACLFVTGALMRREAQRGAVAAAA